MQFLNSFNSLRLDIVGIIAVLGEGSVTRNAQVSALSWYSVLPRLLPAPQALLQHERPKRLPTASGTVVGAYSGNIRHEINFFAQLLHPRYMEEYEVELVEVTKTDEDSSAHSYGPSDRSWLFLLSLLSFAMALGLIALSVVWRDGFSLVSSVLLSMISTAVGVGTHWTLVFPDSKPSRKEGEIPRADVVIYYPHGAIRVIRFGGRHAEAISRLYFQAESCDYTLLDTPYRTVASLATVMLMAAVVCLANASNKSQAAFAGAYIILNFLYWVCSALNPTKHYWQHPFTVRTRSFRHQSNPRAEGVRSRDNVAEPGSRDSQSMFATLRTNAIGEHLMSVWQKLSNSWRFQRIMMASDHRQMYARLSRTRVPEAKKNFTSALWTAIALTGTSSWLNASSHIAPTGPAWDAWIKEAGERVTGEVGEERFIHDLYEPGHVRRLTSRAKTKTMKEVVDRRILLPYWDYQERLSYYLQQQPPRTRTAPKLAEAESDELPAADEEMGTSR